MAMDIGQEEDFSGQPEEASSVFDSIDASNQYAPQLKSLLQQYSQKSSTAASERRRLMQEATTKLLARSQNTNADDAAMYFRLAGALGKPTRTGSFGEQLGNFSEAIAPEIERREEKKRAVQELTDKYKLQGAESDVQDIERQIKLTSQLAKLTGGKRSNVSQMMAERDMLDPKDPRYKTLDDAISKASTSSGSKGGDDEVIRLSKVANDPNQPDYVRKAAAAKLKKELYFKGEGTGSGSGSGEVKAKPQSPAGKLAVDKGFTPGTPEYQKEVDKIVKAGTHLSSKDREELYATDAAVKAGTSALLLLNKAKTINPKAYEGFSAGARRTVARNLPGFKKSEGVTATTNLENILTRQAIGQLKATFGGNPSDAESRLLLRLEGAIDMSVEERDALIDESLAAVARRVREGRDKIKAIKSGGFDIEREEKAEGGQMIANGNQSDYLTEKANEIDFRGGGAVRMKTGGATDTSGGYSAANFGRAVGQGLGMSFGDEAIARVRSMMERRPYEEVLAEERAAYEAFTKRHPGVALGTEVVSGLVPTAASMLIPGGQAAGTANAVRMAPTVAKLAGTSALQGGISGFGAGEGEFTDRLPSAAEGAATSAVLGPAIAKGSTLVGKGISAAKNAVRPSGTAVNERATRKVLEAMGRDEMGVADVRNRLSQDRNLGVKSSIADVSPSTTSLAEAVVTRPGSGRKKLGTMLEERLEEGRESVATRAQKSVGKGVDYTAEENSLMSKLRNNANSHYNKAYSFGSVDDPRILKVLEDDTFKKAYQEAKDIAATEARAAELRGEDVSRFKLLDIYKQDSDGNWIRTGEIPDVRTLDYVKRGIDALIDKGYSGEGMSKAKASALKDLKREYVNVIDDATKVNGTSAYADARKQYAGDIEVLNALRYGKDEFLSPKFTPAQAIEKVKSMSAAEKDALRAGVAQSILGKVMETPNQVNAAQRVIGAPSTRKRLESLFDNPNEYKLFEEALKRESELFRNAQQIVRNSRTANKKEALDDLKKGSSILDIAGDAIDVSAGSPGSMVGRVLKFLQSRTSLDEKSASKIADMLKASSPQEVDSVLTQLEGSSRKFVKKAEATGKREKAVSGAVSRSIGEPPSTPDAPQPQESEQQIIDRYTSDEDAISKEQKEIERLLEEHGGR
jgi:hypothetical protein